MAEKLGVNPFLSMWDKPRSTITQLINYNPKYLVVFLAAAIGIFHILQKMALKGAYRLYNLPEILAIILIAGPLAGIAGVYIGAWLLRLTGSWMGGKASSEHIRAALAWSSVPVLAARLLWIPMLIILLVIRPINIDDLTRGIIMTPIFLIVLCFAIWSLVIFILALSEVQHFSALKAILSLVVSTVIFLAAYLLIILSLSYIEVVHTYGNSGWWLEIW